MFKFWQDQKCRIGAFSSRIGTPAGRHGLALRPNGHPPTTHPLKLQVFDWRREQRTFPWNCGCFGKQSALSKPAKMPRLSMLGPRSCARGNAVDARASNTQSCNGCYPGLRRSGPNLIGFSIRQSEQAPCICFYRCFTRTTPDRQLRCWAAASLRVLPAYTKGQRVTSPVVASGSPSAKVQHSQVYLAHLTRWGTLSAPVCRR